MINGTFWDKKRHSRAPAQNKPNSPLRLAPPPPRQDNPSVPDPLDYRKPQPDDQSVIRQRRARNTFWVGLWTSPVSLVLVLSPFVLGRWAINKYIVAFGVLLDTFVVRSLLVPSIAVLLGRHNWWPSRRAHAS